MSLCYLNEAIKDARGCVQVCPYLHANAWSYWPSMTCWFVVDCVAHLEDVVGEGCIDWSKHGDGHASVNECL